MLIVSLSDSCASRETPHVLIVARFGRRLFGFIDASIGWHIWVFLKSSCPFIENGPMDEVLVITVEATGAMILDTKANIRFCRHVIRLHL